LVLIAARCVRRAYDVLGMHVWRTLAGHYPAGVMSCTGLAQSMQSWGCRGRGRLLHAVLANVLSGSWRGALHSYGGAHRGEFGILWGGGSIMMPCPWEPPGKDSGSRRFQLYKDARAHTVGQRFGRAPAGAEMVPRRSGGIPVERTMEWCLPVFAWSACRRTRAISAGCQWGFDLAAISAQSSSGDNSSAGVYRACTTIE